MVISSISKITQLETRTHFIVFSRFFITSAAYHIEKKRNFAPLLKSTFLRTSAIVNHAHTRQLITITNPQTTASSYFHSSIRNSSCPQLLIQNVQGKCHNDFFILRQMSLPRMHCRSFCDKPDSSPKAISLPRLMDFPQIAWPNIFKTIRNWILSNFIITPYFDREFNIQEFISGSKQAVEFVSMCLAKGDYDKLQDVVAPEALQEIKNSISRFSVQQRADLAVNQEDIYFSFPYQIGVMFNEGQKESEQHRFVEITMCYHVLRGLKELQSQTEKPAWNIGATSEFQDRVFILNYRFIREFTKGVTGEWTVNIVNHYRPSDYV